jgi:hypothetical protein
MTNVLARLARFSLACAALAAAGCGTIYTELKNAGELTPESVVLVGRIELVPPLKSGEQDLKMGTFDPMDAKGALTNRAVLYLSSEPRTGREPTMEALNPELEKTFFVRIPKDKRHMVHGMVLMSHRVTSANRRQVNVDSSELMIPAPIEFDIKPSDRAIYVGTWRLHRDEFNEVTKAQLLDQYSSAAAEFRKKFGSQIILRKALPAPRAPQAAKSR